MLGDLNDIKRRGIKSHLIELKLGSVGVYGSGIVERRGVIEGRRIVSEIGSLSESRGIILVGKVLRDFLGIVFVFTGKLCSEVLRNLFSIIFVLTGEFRGEVLRKLFCVIFVFTGKF